MEWIGANNDIFKQTSYFIEVAELKYGQFSINNNIEELTKLYFDIELHLNKILDFVKQNHILDSDFMKLEYKFRKLVDCNLKYKQKINLGFYKNYQEAHFFYDDVLNELPKNVTLTDVNFDKNNTKYFTLKSYTECVKKYDYKGSKRFEVDLLFATGKAQKLYEKFKKHTNWLKEICLELKLGVEYKPYFSNNFTHKNNSNRSVYNNYEAMIQIKEYCIENNIVICDEFKKELNEIMLKN
jgi:hypothetical protein